MLHTNKGKLTV